MKLSTVHWIHSCQQMYWPAPAPCQEYMNRRSTGAVVSAQSHWVRPGIGLSTGALYLRRLLTGHGGPVFCPEARMDPTASLRCLIEGSIIASYFNATDISTERISLTFLPSYNTIVVFATF